MQCVLYSSQYAIMRYSAKSTEDFKKTKKFVINF